MATLALHATVDSFIAPEPGTDAADHLVRGPVSLALLALAGVAYPRLRAGGRAALAATFIGARVAMRFGRDLRRAVFRQVGECSAREVRDILRMAQQPVSLEKPIGDEEESELGDFVEDEAAISPFERASENLRKENVRRALDALPQREREVIEMRFGLTGARPFTLEEVGRAFNVTRERIRQIENHTLKKLESLPEAQRLRDSA